MAPLPTTINEGNELDSAPKRKALLIGIHYDNDKDFAPLTTPQKDVEAFRRLLLDVYKFKNRDIVVMTDKVGTMLELLPNRNNILRELRQLVKGARSGDDFVFLYSGHSDQLPDETGLERDRLNEVIVPLDYKVDGEGSVDEGTVIVDNDLRKILVKPLPPGCRLTAIFDACHSGTLLDLKHYTCNNFYKPISSQAGAHWKSIRNRTFRSFSFSSPASSSVRVHQKESNGDLVERDPELIDLTSIPRVPTPTDLGLPVSQQVLADNSNAAKPNTPIPLVSSIDFQSGESHRVDTIGIPWQAQAIPPLSLGEAAVVLDRQHTEEDKENHVEKTPRLPPLKVNFSDEPSRDPSPVSVSATDVAECSGDCLPSPTLRPTIVSISACKDSQFTYEDVEGEASTLIQAVIQVLRKSSSLSIGELALSLGNLLELAAQRRVRAFREGIAKELVSRGGKIIPLEVPADFVQEYSLKSQSIQLGSDKPLNRTDMFTL